jgi:very-short-patch-repair endonuclease
MAGSTLTRSHLEELFLQLCRGCGLPAPAVNQRVARYEVDFVWPAEHVIVELDGFAAHGTRAAFERDRARDVELRLAGYTVLRFTYRQVTERPSWVAAQVERALRRGAL